KTQVETIAQTPSPAGGGSGGAAFADAVLARDYSLNISHCLDRGWRLLTERFWPTVGVSALVWILWSLAGSSLVGLIIVSPLVGGLWLYFLNRLRGKSATLETAFSGFQVAFLQLVLAGIVTKVLTVVGFICLVLPGIYLWVAWTFALPLVADRRMDFWSAMNLSRKVVSRHWWKFFWFQLVLLLIYVAGLALCYVGIFVAVPFCLAALACAYEDIFSTPAAPDAPGTHRPAPPSSFGFTAGIVLAAVLLASIGLLSIFSFYRLVHSHPSGVGRPPLTNTGILPVPAGCVACWHADGNAIDSVHGHDGVLQRVRFADGVVGSAFVFDPNSFQRGTYVGVDIPDDPAFALTNAFSIEGWVRPCGDGYTIFWRGDHRPGLDPYFISMGGGHTLQFCICDEFGNVASVGVPVRYDEWSHLAATFADGDMKLYLNGVLAAETNTVVRPFAQLNAGESPGIGIGNVNDGGNDFPFVGDIDEIALYDRALSAAEVRVIYLDEKAAQSNPPASATQSPSVVPSRTPRSSRNETAGARAAADQWLGIIDAGRYVESWRDASDFFRDAMVESGWVASMNAYRQPLGAVISRKPVSAEPATDLPGAPDGQYVVMQFSTVFANKKSAVETVTFVREKDGQWKAAGYFIR
ncbi:MAG TPA: DUF4019 domain-containing protein, partial [Verrucomicrobiae bacterium]|nr:DUF4019 domain-containing protein [Verrucomicrobiae bacterium]